jgi:hypothetical protein
MGVPSWIRMTYGEDEDTSHDDVIQIIEAGKGARRLLISSFYRFLWFHEAR